MPQLPSLADFQRQVPQSRRGISSGGSDGGMSQAVGAIAGAVDSVSKELDAQAVFEARRKLDDWERAAIYDPQDGAINKLGKDSFGLKDAIPKAYDEAAGKIGEGMQTERQKRAFQELAASRRNQILDWTDRHVQRERGVYEQGQFQADMDSVRDRAAMFASDPARIKAEMDVGRQRLIGYYRGKGRSEEEIGAALRDQAEKTHVAVLDTLLAGDNWKGAKAYLNQNAEQMNPAAVLRLNNQITKQEDSVEGTAAAHGVMSYAQPKMQPNDLDRVMNITLQSESGGRRYGADGKLLTSPAGAKGEMQVMDGTNLNPGFGVTPAKDSSSEERARVGRDYLNAMIKRYGGDMPKAWAAYNAGPGRVDDALKTAQEQNDPEWQIFLPKETQDYVAKNMRLLESGGGTPQRPTLQQLHDQVRTTLAGQRPERIKIALEETTRLYKEQTDAIKQRETEAVATAQQGMVQNGGSWNALPPEVRNAVPAGKVDELLTFGQKIAKSEDRTDPIVFNKMATDDAWLKGMSDAEFYVQSRKLSEADGQQMATRRGHLLNKEPSKANNPADLDYGSFNATLNSRLNQMGIDPTPGERDKLGQQRVGAIRAALSAYILQQQQQAGKKFSDADMTKAIDTAISRQINFRHVGFFGGETVKPERLITMQAGDIPPATVEKLKADFKAAGVASPTDGDLLGAYLQLKLR